MDDREAKKRELILVRYEKLRKKVKDWENAIYRTEGRKPSSSDMKQAPKEVQESYREYMKIRKYLGDSTNLPLERNEKLLTPGKIFFGQRVQFHRSELSNSATRTPTKMFRKASANTSREAAPRKSLGLRSSGHSGLGLVPSTAGIAGNSNSNSPNSSSAELPFKKLFKLAEEKEANVNKSELNPENPRSAEDSVIGDKSSETHDLADFNKTSQSSDLLNNFPFVSKTNKNTLGLSENFEQMDFTKKKETQNKKEPLALKSPLAKVKQHSISSRMVDSEWLARVDEDENDDDSEHVAANNSSGSDLGIPKSPTRNRANNSSDSISMEDEVTTMDVDTNEATTCTETALARITHENSDSGICLSSVFNSDEVHQAVKEVLDETKNTATNGGSSVSVSDADGSLLYSFSEDACHPSDHEEPILDANTMSNILKTLAENIGDEDENMESENNPKASASFFDENQSIDDNTYRKRSARFAFSPSPKKAKPRKFFKSSRGERLRPAYYATSYKPRSPLKKVSKSSSYSSTMSANAPIKLTLKKVNASGGNETGTENVKLPTPEKIGSQQLPGSAQSPGESSSKSPSSVKPKAKAKTKRSGRVIKKVDYTEDADNVGEKPEAPAGYSGRKSIVIDVFDEAPTETLLPKTKKGGRQYGGKYRKKQSLESKMKTGTVDDNYVRIDTKRKVFVRGHRKISVTKLKRLDWKNRKMNQGKESKVSTFTCHKCGEKGHFAKFCTKGLVPPSTDEIPVEQQDNSPYPTLVEAARMVYKSAGSNSRVHIYTSKNENLSDETQVEEIKTNDSCPESLEEPLVTTPKLIETVDPVFSDDDSCNPELEEETMLEGLRAFGYDSFRSGQKEAILRVLKGLSTLLILSTGSGKSLCYQLPAYLYAKKYPGALTLCISPLVSLMEDQIQGIPPFLNAACLHSNMTAKQKEVVLDKFKAKQLHILLVSPEAVCGGLFGLLRGNPDSLPKISFACIDEVHCVSQWSHNFRPSYLQLCKILREKLNVKTILGLTATATNTTVESICEHLQVDPSTAIRGELIPKNLKLSVSRDLYKDEALINLLRGERFCNCDSIIIYCTRRDECERIATFVRTKLQEIKVIKTKSGARLSGSCEAYHAGMTPRRRKNVQEGFMSGAIRIVVATVAFGMGIDKSDIRAVIHYNMPNAFESYVQEIGRAGRDGLPAHCHLFLDNAKRSDLCELKRHVYANSVDRPTIRKLLRKVFQPCKCKRIQELKGNSNPEKIACPGHEVSFSIDKCVMDLDLQKENISTLLCYLELGQKRWIEILPLTYETCKIQSYGGPKALKAAASRCPPLAVAIALQKEKGAFFETDAFIEFNVIEAAATVDWSSSIVKKELKNLEWVASEYDSQGNPTRFRKSGLMVEFSNLAYRLRAPGSLSDEDADEVLNSLHGRNLHQERTQLHQLNRVYHALLSVSFPNISNLVDSYDEDKSDKLKNFINEYFSEDATNAEIDISNSPDVNLDDGKVEDLRRSIRRLIDSNRDIDFTSRAIARIFQGITSPCFPQDVWYRNKDFWRRYLDVDFHVICRIASEEL